MSEKGGERKHFSGRRGGWSEKQLNGYLNIDTTKSQIEQKMKEIQRF